MCSMEQNPPQWRYCGVIGGRATAMASQSFYYKNQLEMWGIAMFANGTIGGSGYNFDITFFNESEISMVNDPCSSPYGHHLICMTDWENINNSRSRIDNGIIVTDKWILTSATVCLNIYNQSYTDTDSLVCRHRCLHLVCGHATDTDSVKK